MIRLCCALALPLLAPTAAAEGLLQISLRGKIYSEGGGPVEIEVGVWDGGARRARTVSMDLHLAEGTTSQDLAALLAGRLRSQGAQVVLPQEGSIGREVTSLFIEAATHARLRLGGGLWATVTACEGAPEQVRFLAPQVMKESAQIHIGVSTFHPHTRVRGRVDLIFEAERTLGAARLSEVLTAMSIRQGFRADRPSPDGWHAVRMADGSLITGCSVQLLSPGADWGVEMILGVPLVDPDPSVPR